MLLDDGRAVQQHFFQQMNIIFLLTCIEKDMKTVILFPQLIHDYAFGDAFLYALLMILTGR